MQCFLRLFKSTHFFLPSCHHCFSINFNLTVKGKTMTRGQNKNWGHKTEQFAFSVLKGVLWKTEGHFQDRIIFFQTPLPTSHTKMFTWDV